MLRESPIRVLIVDASPSVRRLLMDVVGRVPDMVVAGEASTGVEAVRMAHSLRPTVVAMTYELPVMDGLKAAQIIMREAPTRIVILGDETDTADLSDQATAAGALDLCAKPSNTLLDDPVVAHFVKTLRAMSQVGVVRHTHKNDGQDVVEGDLLDFPGIRGKPEIVLITSSTGGPQALEVIFRALPDDFPLPIVIVQHISDEFVDNMTNWLDQVTNLTIKMAESGERPKAGTVYFAPIGVHLRIAFNGRFSLDADTDNFRHVPSGDVLFESAAAVFGPNAIGVVLTGMGVDGAAGLLKMREQGARTVVQDEATSVVFGMPKAAIELGGAEFVVPLEQIAARLGKLATEKRQEKSDTP